MSYPERQVALPRWHLTCLEEPHTCRLTLYCRFPNLNCDADYINILALSPTFSSVQNACLRILFGGNVCDSFSL